MIHEGYCNIFVNKFLVTVSVREVARRSGCIVRCFGTIWLFTIIWYCVLLDKGVGGYYTDFNRVLSSNIYETPTILLIYVFSKCSNKRQKVWPKEKFAVNKHIAFNKRVEKLLYVQKFLTTQTKSNKTIHYWFSIALLVQHFLNYLDPIFSITFGKCTQHVSYWINWHCSRTMIMYATVKQYVK